MTVDRQTHDRRLRPGLVAAYTDSYRGPQDAAPDADDLTADGGDGQPQASPRLLDAHRQLGERRQPGETLVAVRGDDSGFGPALQIVTDASPMAVESVTVLLQRRGVPYVATMSPVLHADRDEDGALRDLDADGPGDAEAWIHVQLAPGADPDATAAAARELPGVLADARLVGEDTTAMRDALHAVADTLDAGPDEGDSDGPSRAEVAALLRWLGDGNFVLTGYQRCTVSDGEAVVDGASRLGVLRHRRDVFPPLTGPGDVLVLVQATIPSFLRYGTFPHVVVVREETSDAALEHRFVGLFTVAAANTDVLDIPVVAGRVRAALRRSGLDESALPGQLLLDVIQTFPRSELFSLSDERVLAMATALAEPGSRRRTVLFLRSDQLGHFVSCLVYLPRDRYTTAVRLHMQDILVAELGGTGIEYTARVSESSWAAVHFTVRLPPGSGPGDVDTSDGNRLRIQQLLTEAARTWADRLLEAHTADGIERRVAEHYADAFSEAYKQAVEPAAALADIAIIEELQDGAVHLEFAGGTRRDGQGSPGDGDGVARLTWYLGGRSASLSQLLPMLQSMGVVVLDERPFTVTRPDGLDTWIYQFRISPHPTMPELPEDDGAGADELARRFADTVTAIWHGRVEIDHFNELVMRAGLTWQQVTVLRAYAKYLRQTGFPYSQTHLENVLNANPRTACSLITLFEALFDPDPEQAQRHDAQAAADAVAEDIDAQTSLDTDRALRAFASLIQATLRTNYFVTRTGSARELDVVAVKLNPGLIDELPLPRPQFEIFVYSPRVEGVHLRFGPVARGGLRWSDRREDFRTEILGLVKAQAVKNAVIVPVGAKGGFVVKQPPMLTGDDAADREATRDEGVACYRRFIAGLLDVTDNVDKGTGEIVAPQRVVRRDEDDAYLVVAADKGTATFSDIANEVAQSYGFWLGDAFASGGSVGYDHKAMGITAKGAWEAVKRHFRELGVDTQRDDFTVAGIGDMSGDVFGNAMLLSEHIKLVAAFDHRHVFLDPDPDAAASFRERKRLFDQPRSSWEDYDTSLISEGGGVFSRQHKSIALTEQIRTALGLADDVSELTPPQLVRAILLAPVDLLFNGGIGTYVKAETEPNSDVGDRANDAVRVNGKDLRAKVVGEGGNLGVTPLGRVEYDLAGGHINTDALDNSAGVDCSDHEVNIKILVDSLVTAGKVAAEDRTELLESMTDDVAHLVLSDNVRQNDLMGTSRANAASLLSVHARQIRELEEQRGLHRELEALPSPKEIRRRTEQRIGLTSPELSTLMAHVKLALKDDVLDTDLPDQDVFASRLPRYFPARLRDEFGADIRQHQLRREILTTTLVNDVVDCSGITYAYRITDDVGVSSVDAVRTFVATDAIFESSDLWRRIRESGAPVDITDRMTLDLRRLLDRSARWLLNYRPQPLAVGAEINRFAAAVRELTPKLPEWLRGDDRAIVEDTTRDFTDAGVDEDLAYRVAVGLYRFSLLDIIEIADISERDGTEVADTYFALMHHLNTDALLTAVSELRRDDRWHALARLAIRDDIYSSLRTLCFDVLRAGEPDETGEEKIAEWEATNSSRIGRARRTLREIYAADTADLATLSVASRQIRSMTRSGTGNAT
ncbi:NAD-glutamate dehydrogenase [Mycobacterium sp. MYCO198283]|uniref:NAD-glutamate dehydrogenase n=1 Tax=Mycobacterium sp. MYCO198283 TaxID=2883505 RepID=UPI001E2AC7AD|nr:NAD-glutamate dehydrogenase [Mycobacterium sp. MYCO198283]MCG5432449.1 NAD-glutamate dehydrogenase [Mycobacterium sp. MYCO198283]